MTQISKSEAYPWDEASCPCTKDTNIGLLLIHQRSGDDSRGGFMEDPVMVTICKLPLL